MTSVAPHVPKLRALEALHAGKLSGAGHTRLSKHLLECETCRQTLRGLRLHEHLAAEVRTESPAMDFERIALALRREARTVAQRERRQRYVPWLAVAAAALLVVLLRWQDTRTAHAPLAPKPASVSPQPTVPSALLTAYVTVLRGQGEVRGAGGARTPLTIASALREGETLSLLQDGHAELHLDVGTGIALEAQSAATFRALRSDAVEIALEAGAVTSVVRPLRADQRYRILALGYVVEVRGTLFRVAVHGQELSVEVDEGRVAVIDALGHLVADLVAPARYHPARGPSRDANGLRSPQPLSLPLSHWATLSLPKLAGVTEWSVAGYASPASAQLTMRVPRGDVTLIATLTDGREQRHVLPVPEGGAVIDEVQLRRLLNLDAQTQRDTLLDAQTLQQVITRGTPTLQRCYERSLKQHSAISGRLTLRFVLDTRGRVRSVAPREQADGMPEELLACIRQSAMRWQFPAPGSGGITFDAPIRLAKGR